MHTNASPLHYITVTSWMVVTVPVLILDRLIGQVLTRLILPYHLLSNPMKSWHHTFAGKLFAQTGVSFGSVQLHREPPKLILVYSVDGTVRQPEILSW